MNREAISIRERLQPGDLGYIIYLHGSLYAQENGWDTSFEVYVAEPLTAFMKHIGPREGIWIAEHNGEILGCIAMVERSDVEVQLRWFLIHPKARGMGLGQRLMDEALKFARENRFQRVSLWTVSQQEAAGHMYKKSGFQITQEQERSQWGATVLEQKYERNL